MSTNTEGTPHVNPNPGRPAHTTAVRTTIPWWATLAVALLVIVGALVAVPAFAHTPAGSASCNGITGAMRNATDDFTSTITLYVDREAIASDTRKGNWSLSRDVPQDYDEHSWRVVVDAGQYSGRESGTFGPCKTKPTEPTPTSTPTPTEPEDTPSPSHTPSATPTPTPSGTPTPSDTPTTPVTNSPGTPTPTGTPSPSSTPTPTGSPSSTPTPDIGTPTSSTNPPTSTPSAPHGSTPTKPDVPRSVPPQPSTPHVSKPHGPRTKPHCAISNTDRNADCQPDIGGPHSDVVEEGF